MRCPAVALLSSCVLLTSCSIERSALGMQSLDAGSGLDDAGRGDAGGRRDAGPRDASPRDAPPVDGGFDAGTGPPACDPADPDLVACWRFEESAEDSGPRALHATATEVSYQDGVIGDALATRATSTVRVPWNAALDVPRITLEVWIRPDVIPTAGRAGVMDKNGSWGIFLHPGGQVRCSAASAWAVSPDGVIAPGVWTHLACTYDGATTLLYVNGALVTALPSPGGIPTPPSDLHFAEDSPSGGDQLVGLLDELRIWSVALPPDRIAASARPPEL